MVGSLFNLYREMKEQTMLTHSHSLCLARGTSTMFLLQKTSLLALETAVK